eukprot:m.38391 g.38391  ORF g.38391 m.38391 type:complete len:292 (+) comp12588_c0_seq35:84-959(+)
MGSFTALVLLNVLSLATTKPFNEPYPWVTAGGTSYKLWSTREPRFYICLSHKVACSEWLRYIHKEMLPSSRVPEGLDIYNPTSFHQQGLVRLKHTTKSQYDEVAKIAQDPEVYKFAVVRHPWDRLNSGYRSKYEGLCKHNITCFKARFVHTVKDGDGILSFHDFVKALSEIPALHLNSHFRPQTLTCDLTTFPYDEFVDLKNITQMDLAAKRSGFKTPFSQASHEYGVSGENGRPTHKCHYCNWETVRLAEVIYGVDAAVLGYNFDDAYASCKEHGVSVWKPDMNVSELCI